jgi:hypothetical protein
LVLISIAGVILKRRRGRRITFRIRKAMFRLLFDLADSVETNIPELCKIMILMGSILEYMRFEDDEYLKQFVSAARMSRLTDYVADENPLKPSLSSLSGIEAFLVRGPGRNRPHLEGSELVKVRLPPVLVRRIDLYAKLTKASRSAMLTRFFEKGLLFYMRSQTTLMKALAEALLDKEHQHKVS